MDSHFNKPLQSLMDYTENLHKCHGYLKALEEERTKIELFQRELPLSLDLVTRAIEAFKQQKSNINTECSEETTSDGPVFEEFMPIKKRCSSREEKGDDDSELESRNNFNDDGSGEGKKLDWLRSVQLWNQAIDPPTEEEHQIKQSAIEVKRNGGAFHPFKKETKTTTSVGPTAATVEEAGGDKEGGEGEPKKARRCWSPELHRRFLNALQQLGGSHAATPKQIKELMNVDGLTNDEVKSHLQKFRLHNRRPAAAAAPHGNTSTQAPQFFVVGGIWVPPPRQTGGMPGGIVVPVAAQAPAVLPHHHQAQKEQEKLTSTSSESARCNSSVTSSSTHTTTTSPA